MHCERIQLLSICRGESWCSLSRTTPSGTESRHASVYLTELCKVVVGVHCIVSRATPRKPAYSHSCSRFASPRGMRTRWISSFPTRSPFGGIQRERVMGWRMDGGCDMDAIGMGRERVDRQSLSSCGCCFSDCYPSRTRLWCTETESTSSVT